MSRKFKSIAMKKKKEYVLDLSDCITARTRSKLSAKNTTYFKHYQSHHKPFSRSQKSMSASAISVVDCENKNFIWEASNNCFIELEHYSLEDIACHYDVDISEYISAKKRQGASNDAAIKIIKALLKKGNKKMNVKPENGLILLGRNSNKMIEFYCSKVKRGDLAVFWQESAVCVMEVHSSPFICTVRKLVYDIIDLIRVSKAHGIDDVTLIGFALPKLSVKRSIIKVSVSYTCTTKKFKCKYNMLDIPGFIGDLMNAIKQNMTVVKQCQKGGYSEDGEKLLIPLSASEILEYGTDPIQLPAHYGLIIEATNQVPQRCIFKIPMYKHSLHNISQVMDRCKNMPSIVQYSIFRNDTFFYKKVVHDPLSCKEVAKCAINLIPAVHLAVQELKKKRIVHSDIRIPNICFNEQLNPVLIDFDFCKFLNDDDDDDDDCSDIKMFAEDLMIHLFESKMFTEDELCSDALLKQLHNGHFIEILTAQSVLSRSAFTTEEIIKERGN